MLILYKRKKTKTIVYLVILLTILISLIAYISLRKIQNRDLPIEELDEYSKELKSISSELQEQLETYIGNLKAEGILSNDDTVSFYVFDITKIRKIVSLNDDKPLQLASMIKPLVALAFFHQVKYDGMVYDKISRRRMERMIRESSNPCTNWFIRKIGGPKKVQEILEKYYGTILTETKIVEYIPVDGKTYLNKASLTDYGRFLYALWNNILPYSNEILRVMALENDDMLLRRVEGMPQDVLVYDKTGSTSYVIGNMGILVPQDEEGKTFPYIIACVIQRHVLAPNYTIWYRTTRPIIRVMSGIIYPQMKRIHELRPNL